MVTSDLLSLNTKEVDKKVSGYKQLKRLFISHVCVSLCNR